MKVIRTVCLVIVAAGLGVAGTGLYFKQEKPKQPAANTGVKNTQQLADQLKVGPEVLYVDQLTQRKINKLRRQSLYAGGTKKVYPHITMQETDLTGSMTKLDVRFWGHNNFLEKYMSSQAYQACQLLSSRLENPKSPQDRQICQRQIQPLLQQLMQYSNAMVAIEACRALIASGDLSPALEKCLTQMAQEPNQFSEQAAELLKKCGWAVPKPWPALDEIPEYKHTAPKGKKALPAGALARIGQKKLRHGKKVMAMAFSHDSKLLASSGRDSYVRLWDVVTGRELAKVKLARKPGILAFRPDGSVVIKANSSVFLWTPKDQSIKELLPAKKYQADRIAVSPDGKLLARREFRTVHFHSLPDGKPLDNAGSKLTFKADLLVMKFLKDSKTLLCTTAKGKHYLADAYTGKVLAEISQRALACVSLEDSTIVMAYDGKLNFYNSDGTLRNTKPLPNGFNLATTDGKHLILTSKTETRIVDPNTLQPVAPKISDKIYPNAVSLNGRWLAARNRSAIRIWDTTTGNEVHNDMALAGKAQILGNDIYASDKIYVSSKAGNDKAIYSINVDTRQCNLLRKEKGSDDCWGVSKDGKLLATYSNYDPKTASQTSSRHSLWIANLKTGKYLYELPSFSHMSMTFDPYSPWLIAQGAGCLSVYNLDKRTMNYRLPAQLASPVFLNNDFWRKHKNKITSNFPVSFLALSKNRLQAWSSVNNMQPVDFNPTLNVTAFALSKKSDKVATISPSPFTWFSATLRLWKTAGLWTEKKDFGDETTAEMTDMCVLQVRSDKPFAESVLSVTFSPDGKFLLTTHKGRGDIVVWNLKGRPLCRLAGHKGEITDIRFARNKLVSASEDATPLIWDWHAIQKSCEAEAAKTLAKKAG